MFSKSIGILISAVTLSFGTLILDLPKGAESIGLGNSGVAFSNEPNSVILNPANGAFYGARSGLNAWGSYSSSAPFIDSTIKLRISSVGGYFEEGLWGAGVEISLNVLNYGQFDMYDANGNISDSISPRDQVGAFTASVQWNNIISAGATAKPIAVDLWDGGKEKGILFDVGLRGQYKKDISEKFYLLPGMGVSFLNLGSDSIRGDGLKTSPVAGKTVVGGLSFECGMPDAFWIMAEEDISKLIVKNGYDLDENPTWRTGIQIGLTPLFQFHLGNEKYEAAYLRRSESVNIDTVRINRSEFHWGLTTGYRNIKFMKFLNQMSKSKEFSTDRRNFEILYTLGVVKKDYWNGFKTYTHQISGGIELGRKKK